MAGLCGIKIDAATFVVSLDEGVGPSALPPPRRVADLSEADLRRTILYVMH
jgi:hypothetical protein